MTVDYKFTMTLTNKEIETIQSIYQALADRALTVTQIFEVFHNISDGLGVDNLASIALPFGVTIEREIPNEDD